MPRSDTGMNPFDRFVVILYALWSLLLCSIIVVYVIHAAKIVQKNLGL